MEPGSAPDDVWERVEAVLLGASELGAEAATSGALEAYLDSACGGDRELRRQVDRLLDQDGEVANRFDAALAAGVAGAAAEVLASLDPEVTQLGLGEVGGGHGDVDVPNEGASVQPPHLGAYRLLERLGEGGTGTVFRAVPRDGDGEAVAIKILRHGPWSPLAARRFAAERQFLGRLDHPNIARLLDGGTTPNGSPFLVMELVEGEPIDAYCARRGLTIDERIRLFLPVCAAVHEAHRNQIVHRDLKPSNVLVTHDGTPKLLDFGIAKWLDPGAESMTGSQVPMTPRYASPEQLAGERVTTVSDVYSLGLLLHELLTGRRLFGDAETPAAVLERRARDGRPESPSRVAPPEVRRELRGNLDRVLGMALAEEPEARYSSVARFADDLGRHLARQPVHARPKALGYRLGRFLRRYRLGLTLCAAILVGSVAMIQGIRLDHEQKRHQRALVGLRELIGLADTDAGPGDSVTHREILDRAAEQIADLPPDREMAGVLTTLAEGYSRLGIGERATEFYQRALAIAHQTGDAEMIAENTNSLAIANAQTGEFDVAEGLFEEALELRRRLHGDEHPKVAASLNNLALINHDLGRYAKARRLYLQALALDQRLLGEGHESTAMTESNLALLDLDEGRFEAAAERYRSVLDQLSKRVASDDSELAEPSEMLALALAETGDGEEALELARRALEIRRRSFGDEHRKVARSLHTWGRVLWLTGDAEGAAEPLEKALDLRVAILGEAHAETAASLAHLGEQRATVGDHPAAIHFLDRAVDAYSAALPDGHPLRAGTAVELAMVWIDAGRCDRALDPLDDALTILVPGSWQAAEAEAARAWCRGDPGAVARHRQTVAAALGDDHRRVGRLGSWIDRDPIDQGEGGVSSPGV